MSLSPGTRLGPDEILAPLGAGGMGQVYRARDTRLGRDVALKALPDSFTDNPERLARFRREAQVLASLNHPHIGAIDGLEEAAGQQVLVLELVDGDTLADRIARGAIPAGDAVAIARQIAEALEAAHDKGIVHRDLKPANIIVQGGSSLGELRAKVLDFGLAKSLTGGAFGLETETDAGATADGRILGTPAYMSPEQARGEPADKRTDIWAFGCVLFEMLTGSRPFAGATATDTIARILERDIEWSALPAATPEHIRRLLERCLRKDPRKRLRDIADAVIEVDDAGQVSLASARETSPGVPFLETPYYENSGVFSPDGKWIAYESDESGRRNVYVRPFPSGSEQFRISRDGGRAPRWRGDGKELFFMALDGMLMAADIETATSVRAGWRALGLKSP